MQTSPIPAVQAVPVIQEIKQDLPIFRYAYKDKSFHQPGLIKFIGTLIPGIRLPLFRNKKSDSCKQPNPALTRN